MTIGELKRRMESWRVCRYADDTPITAALVAGTGDDTREGLRWAVRDIVDVSGGPEGPYICVELTERQEAGL